VSDGLEDGWLIDPERAPGAADLAGALVAITRQVAGDQQNS
jgi:hypothetical protein